MERTAMKKPDDRDCYICPHCGEQVKHRSPYMYASRHIRDVRVQLIDRWNVPYSTGIYILTHDDVPKKEIEEYANKQTVFPLWPLVRRGILWSKSTWCD